MPHLQWHAYSMFDDVSDVIRGAPGDGSVTASPNTLMPHSPSVLLVPGRVIRTVRPMPLQLTCFEFFPPESGDSTSVWHLTPPTSMVTLSSRLVESSATTSTQYTLA